MNVMLNLFLRMWVLRANPQDLPASRALTYGLAVIYMLSSLFSVLAEASLARAFAASAVDLALLVAVVHTLLLMAKVPERGYQTFSAVFGTSIILVIVSTVFMYALGSTEIRATMLLLLLAWYLLIVGHILRQAISVPVLLGALITLMYLMVSAGVTSFLLFPTQIGGQ